MHEEILDMLVKKDDMTWQSLIQDLVRTEKMSPWDINVSLLAQKYIETLREIRDHDFRISGKVLLCAAILLKIQSTKLVNEEISELDKLIEGEQESEEDFYNNLLDIEQEGDNIVFDAPELVPKTPQPRKRKVSVQDLMKALQKALDVKKRRLIKRMPPEVAIPEKKKDITLVIKDIHGTIKEFFNTQEYGSLFFHELLDEELTKHEKVMHLIPILHLTNQRRIDLLQTKHFGEIEILVPGTHRMKTIKQHQEQAYDQYEDIITEEAKKKAEKSAKLRKAYKARQKAQSEST